MSFLFIAVSSHNSKDSMSRLCGWTGSIYDTFLRLFFMCTSYFI